MIHGVLSLILANVNGGAPSLGGLNLNGANRPDEATQVWRLRPGESPLTRRMWRSVGRSDQVISPCRKLLAKQQWTERLYLPFLSTVIYCEGGGRN